MDLIVNHSELNDFCDMSNVQSELMAEQIKVWQDKLDELKDVWQGEDADTFFDNATSYVNRLTIIPECYDSLTEFVGSANKEYHQKDLDNKKEFEKEAAYKEGATNG